MDKIVTGDLESQDSNDEGATGSTLVATTILHPMVRALAFSASNKAHNRVLEQAAAFNSTIHTASTQQSTCLPIDRSHFSHLRSHLQKLRRGRA
jgi:hypothetical protein